MAVPEDLAQYVLAVQTVPGFPELKPESPTALFQRPDWQGDHDQQLNE